MTHNQLKAMLLAAESREEAEIYFDDNLQKRKDYYKLMSGEQVKTFFRLYEKARLVEEYESKLPKEQRYGVSCRSYPERINEVFDIYRKNGDIGEPHEFREIGENERTQRREVQEKAEIAYKNFLLGTTQRKISESNNDPTKTAIRRDIQTFLKEDTPENKAWNDEIINVWGKKDSTVNQKKASLTKLLISLSDQINVDDLKRNRTDAELVDYMSKKENIVLINTLIEGEGLVKLAKELNIDKKLTDRLQYLYNDTSGNVTSMQMRLATIANPYYADLDYADLMAVDPDFMSNMIEDYIDGDETIMTENGYSDFTNSSQAETVNEFFANMGYMYNDSLGKLDCVVCQITNKEHTENICTASGIYLDCPSFEKEQINHSGMKGFARPGKTSLIEHPDDPHKFTEIAFDIKRNTFTAQDITLPCSAKEMRETKEPGFFSKVFDGVAKIFGKRVESCRKWEIKQSALRQIEEIHSKDAPTVDEYIKEKGYTVFRPVDLTKDDKNRLMTNVKTASYVADFEKAVSGPSAEKKENEPAPGQKELGRLVAARLLCSSDKEPTPENVDALYGRLSKDSEFNTRIGTALSEPGNARKIAADPAELNKAYKAIVENLQKDSLPDKEIQPAKTIEISGPNVSGPAVAC